MSEPTSADDLPPFVSLEPYEGDEWVRLEDSIGQPHIIVEVLTRYISSIFSTRSLVPGIIEELHSQYITAQVNYTQLADSFRTQGRDGADEHRPRHEMPQSKQTRYLRSRKKLDDASYSRNNVPNFFLLGLVSQYDAFVGSLMRALFTLKPELVYASERTLSIDDLRTLTNLEGAYKFIVEKDIETTLRDSHLGQFTRLEARFNIKTLRVFDELPDFVEIMERRNLVAHNAGIVSNRYIQGCMEAGFSRSDTVVVGDHIVVNEEYLERAQRVLYLVGVRLAHVLWRKVRPDEMWMADKVLSRTCYTLLVFEEWELAKTLLKFAVTLQSHSSEHEKRIFVINLAQAYKWAGETERCEATLRSIDWSASDDAFMLATFILRDDFVNAARHMRIVASNGDVPESAFLDWPLFREFRKTDLFEPVFEAVFGHASRQGPC